MRIEDVTRGPVSTAAGSVLAATVAGIRAMRRPRPLHPHGVALRGRVDWVDHRVTSGIGWIDDGSVSGQVVEARLSRGVGLPTAFPDVWGLAFRVTTGSGPADVLLASTGLGVPDRWLLRPARRPGGLRYTSLMPYRGAFGPVLLAARALPGAPLPADPDGTAAALDEGSWVLQLLHAEPLGVWHPFARLVLARDAGTTDTDTPTRFDPVLHPLPGSGTYRWTRNLREPGYAVARSGVSGLLRASRPAPVPTSGPAHRYRGAP